MTNYTFIVSAGAGDAIRDFYWNGQYMSLEDLGPEDACDIHITGINPFLHEFFSWHPRASHLTVKSYGYFVPDQEEELKRLHGIPLEGEYTPLPRSTKPVVFYPSPFDSQFVDVIDAIHEKYGTKGYLMSSIAAGDSDRTFPQDLKMKAQSLMGPDTGFAPYVNLAVGRNFKRGDRFEDTMSIGDWNIGAVDCLSLPGTCKLLEGAVGLVTCHSALSMLAFLIHKPQLLLYPEEVRQRHFLRPDLWSFGASCPECIHGTFEDFEKNGDEMIAEFLTMMKAGGK